MHPDRHHRAQGPPIASPPSASRRPQASPTSFFSTSKPPSKLNTLRTPRFKPNGIFLRPQSGAGLPHCLRMTIGPPDHVDIALTALEDWVQEVRP
jgi:histidinol-phosphate/aromatic aminotransferase/cobyric acid decarboxylase-like protein